MSVAESLGSHSLNSFADFLQHHLNSPEASSCRHSPVKPILSLLAMAEDNAPAPRKGGRQRRQDTAKDLPTHLYEEYKSDPDETYKDRKSQTQWIRRYWSEEWFFYRFVTPEYSEKCAKKAPWGDIV